MSSPAQLIAALTADVDKMRTALLDGDLVDLTGLDHRVQTVCDAVLSLPSGEARAARADMEALLAAIDALEMVLVSQQGAFLAQPPPPHSTTDG